MEWSTKFVKSLLTALRQGQKTRLQVLQKYCALPREVDSIILLADVLSLNAADAA
jgi:hypothetical protein